MISISQIPDIIGKFPGMRKDQEWTVYPFEANPEYHLIQSSVRIAHINMKDHTAMLSKHVSSGAYNHHLSPLLGAKKVQCPQEIIEQLKALKPTGKQVLIQ